MSRPLIPFLMCLTLCLAAALTPLWAETNAQEVEEDNSLASDFVTPHKDWGGGYVGGKIRALFFIYTGPYDGTWEDTGTRVREVVELGQRFDLDADAALFCGSGNNWVFHGLKLGEDRAERLLQQPYQLYVIAGFPMERLPAKMQYEILKQVAGGAGLLCCGQGAAEYLIPRRQLEPTPPALVEGLPEVSGNNLPATATAYQLGKGRGVWLKYSAATLTPGQSFTWQWLVDYDYWMLLVGRAAVWAAGRTGDVSVTSVLGDAPLRAPYGEAVQGAQIRFGNRGMQALEATAEVRLRRGWDGQERSLGDLPVTLAPGQDNAVSVSLPTLRAGSYYVDVVVKSKRGTEAFGAGNLVVESDCGVADMGVSKAFVEQGEVMTGTITLRGAPPPDSRLRIAFRDSYDRILKQTEVDVRLDVTEYPFTYEADGFSTILMRAEATLVVGGEEVEMKSSSFTVPKRRQGQMNFVMWDAPLDTLGLYTWRQLQEKGHNVCLLGSMGGKRAIPMALAAGDASLAPYSTRILDPKDGEGQMQPVCWNDDAAAGEYVQQIVDNQSNLREQGVFVYSLGDEGVTLGCCVHPACIAAYRRYLATQYADIAALNASWGTEYKSFDEVDLLSHQDNMELAAAKTNFPRWYDRQAFARYNLMQFSGRFVKAYRELDPKSLTGFEGTGGFGDDYDQILGVNDWYGPYPSIGDDIVRSAAPRAMPRSNWMGYSKTGDALSDAAWRMVIKGMDGVWYWMWSGIGSWRGYLRPTLDYWPAIDDLAKEMEPVRQGLGDLILKSKPLHSGVGVLYSLPSALSGQLENSGQFVSPQQAHENVTRLTYDLGMDFRYLTSKMLLDGELGNDEFKVLLLPMTQALSAEEAATIRGFVERGGTVVADVRPGVYDGHCKAVLPGVMDDLFGIKRTGRGKPADAKVTLDLPTGAADLGEVRVDTEVLCETAVPLAQVKVGEQDVPVILSNAVGSGRAILLNLVLPAANPREPRTAAARVLYKWLYETAGAASAVTIARPGGGPTPLTESRVWQTGEALMVGTWRQMENEWFGPKSGTIAGEPEAARITFPSPRHVYDLRARKYLGSRKFVDSSLRWGRANFYLALPYEIGPLSLRLDSADPAPGRPLTAAISLQVPPGRGETFAAWVEVFDPSGQELLWGRQVVMLQGGQGQVQVARAFNDAPGVWRLRVTELFSNQSAEATWTVR